MLNQRAACCRPVGGPKSCTSPAQLDNGKGLKYRLPAAVLMLLLLGSQLLWHAFPP